MRKIFHIRDPRGEGFALGLWTKIILFLHNHEFKDNFI